MVANGSAINVCVQHRLRLLRVGVANLLHAEPGINVVGRAVSGADAARLAALHRPHVVVLELDGDGADACRTAAAVRAEAPTTRFVALAQDNRLHRVGLHPAAAVTFPVRVYREEGFQAVLDAVTTVRLGLVLPVVEPNEPMADSLSPREIDVLALVGAGCTTQEISERLAISRKTVENHKQHIFSKLRVRNQAHAVAVALRAGMISVDGVIDLRGAV